MSPSSHPSGIEALERARHSDDMHTVTAALLLTARFYSIVAVPAGDRVAATQVAAHILHAAGIDVLWTDCNDRFSAHQSATSEVCLTPPSPGDVIVRFVVSAPVANGPRNWAGDSLGDAYVDTAAATGSLATVYVDRVGVMARAAGVDAGTLLGRVMAHEIGHLLLGTAAHRPSGLMRAEWSTTLLQRRIANDWRFSNFDAAGARDGVLRRTRAIGSTTDPSTLATVPCHASASDTVQATCPSCPVCASWSPADRVPFDLLVEPRF